MCRVPPSISEKPPAGKACQAATSPLKQLGKGGYDLWSVGRLRVSQRNAHDDYLPEHDDGDGDCDDPAVYALPKLDLSHPIPLLRSSWPRQGSTTCKSEHSATGTCSRGGMVSSMNVIIGCEAILPHPPTETREPISLLPPRRSRAEARSDSTIGRDHQDI